MGNATAADVLRNELANRQRKNPSYSLRSFAQSLELDAGTLSAILSERRAVPKSKAVRIAARLGLSPSDASLMTDPNVGRKLRGLSKIKALSKRAKVIGDDHFRVLAEWEHFAILSLLEIEGFKPDSQWVAKRLGISKLHAERALNLIREMNLVTIKGKRWCKNFETLATPEDIVSAALQASHRDNLELAATKLRDVPPEARDFSSITMAIDPARLAEAKTLIREFRKKLAAYLEKGRPRAVYRLSLQLFPLTHLEDP